MEYVFGVGYRIKDVIFSSKLADNPTGIIKSDINLKLDASYRNSKTIVRYLDYDNNQLSGGQNVWSLKLGADYAFSQKSDGVVLLRPFVLESGNLNIVPDDQYPRRIYDAIQFRELN